MNPGKISKYTQIIAQRTGSYILSKLGGISGLEFKGERNLVTEVDKTAEHMVKDYLGKKFPSFKFRGEEFGGDIDSEYYWLVDPLDGTNNFTHSFPVFCVSIALLKDKKPLLGVVYDPNREEMFSAVCDRGACLNKKTIVVSKIDKLKRALLATGFCYEFKDQSDTNIGHFTNFIYHAQGIRRCGAAAIDLAYVASGRLDGFWELGLNPWDTAAGILLVQEAGGRVSRFDGSSYDPFYPNILASNGLIHELSLIHISEPTRPY